MDWRDQLQRDSGSCLEELVAAHPEFSLDADQPSYRGGTHHVTFGCYRGRPAAFKYFVNARRWRNEAACLARLQHTGLVPKAFHELEGTLIVMERLGGADVLNPRALETLDAERTHTLSREVGAAFGHLVTMGMAESVDGYDPLTDFPDWGWSVGLPSVVDQCFRLGRTIADLSDSLSAEILRSSLRLIEERVTAVLREPWILFHEDVSNLRVDGTRFVGFYDLELCRGGTPSMQLGAMLNLAGPGRLDWRGLVEGFEHALGVTLTSEDLRSALAMNHLSEWIRLCVLLDGEDRAVDDATLAAAEERAKRMRVTGRAAGRADRSPRG